MEELKKYLEAELKRCDAILWDLSAHDYENQNHFESYSEGVQFALDWIEEHGKA